MSGLAVYALNSRRRCCCKRTITVSDIITVCQHVWGMLFYLSLDLSDLCADNILIIGSQCSADGVMSGITWVFFLGWSYRRHERRLERREEPPCIKPPAEQRVMCLQKRLRRSKGRLCIKPAAVSFNIKSSAKQRVMCLRKRLHLFLHMWVSRLPLLMYRCIAETCLVICRQL